MTTESLPVLEHELPDSLPATHDQAPAATEPRRDGVIGFTVTLLIEVVAGTWLLCLFLLALAWQPVDRGLGLRTRRIAARTALRTAYTAGLDEGHPLERVETEAVGGVAGTSGASGASGHPTPGRVATAVA